MRLELTGKLIVELSEGIDFRVKQRGGVTHLVIDFKVGKEEKEESQGRDTQVAVSANTKRKISPKLSEEEKAEIVRKYEEGFSTSQLVEKYSTTRARIKKALAEAGAQLRDERREGRKHLDMPKKLSEEDVVEIVRKYEAGTSTSYLVKRYSSTRAHIRKVLVEAGVELRDERKDGKARTEKLKKGEKDAIDRFHCMGMTPEEIAHEMALNLNQIVYYLKSNNML